MNPLQSEHTLTWTLLNFNTNESDRTPDHILQNYVNTLNPIFIVKCQGVNDDERSAIYIDFYLIGFHI